VLIKVFLLEMEEERMVLDVGLEPTTSAMS
jgi:hypothetical protein